MEGRPASREKAKGMSQYISDENGEQDQVASNLGWSLFCEWAETLDPIKFLEVRHLCEQGWEQDLDDLAEQLQEGIETEGVSPDIIDIAEGIIAFIDDGEVDDREIVMITNGIEDAGDEYDHELANRDKSTDA